LRIGLWDHGADSSGAFALIFLRRTIARDAFAANRRIRAVAPLFPQGVLLRNPYLDFSY
jgi:hypothetical protein